MDCAQKHVALATDQGNNMKRVPDDKMIILDHLSTETKTRVDAEHNTIMAQAYAQIDQLIEEYKKQIREISVELNHLPLNQISSFAERMTTEIEYINEGNS
jgi:ATP-dependent Zn protease